MFTISTIKDLEIELYIDGAGKEPGFMECSQSERLIFNFTALSNPLYVCRMLH